MHSSILLHLLLTPFYLGIVTSQEDSNFVCDIPTAGCSNGMFNQDKCKCECISPFCPDIDGDCTSPTNDCGSNPWKDCVRGVDCPWWTNALKAESCTTGPDVPYGTWGIFNTKKACCNSNFAYSIMCDIKPATEPPTKHPTIYQVQNDDYEVIPLKFVVMGLPDGVETSNLNNQTTTVLKRILLRLSDRIPDLKVSSVEEKATLGNNRNLLLLRIRELEQTVTMYYNVYVIRDERKKFGPIIIQEIRDSYGEVLDQIRTFTDTNVFGAAENLSLNLCTSQNGNFNLCVQETSRPTPPPTRRPPGLAPVVINTETGPTDTGGGLAHWAIALIVIFVFVAVGCGVFAMFFFGIACFRDDDYDERKYDNYFDDKESVYTSKSRDNGSRDGRNTNSRRSQQLRLEDRPQQLRLMAAVPEDRSQQLQLMDAMSVNSRNTINTKKSVSSRAGSRKKRASRDPTMFLIGQDNKPDPGMGSVTSSRRYYNTHEDPPLKPKRDPTMFVDGRRDAPSRRYIEDGSSTKPKRDPEGQQDPKVYIDEDEKDPSSTSDPSTSAPSILTQDNQDEYLFRSETVSVEEMYNDDQYYKPPSNKKSFGTSDVEKEEAEFDNFGFRKSAGSSNYDEDARHNSRIGDYSSSSSDDSEDDRRTNHRHSMTSGKSRKSGRSKRSNRRRT